MKGPNLWRVQQRAKFAKMRDANLRCDISFATHDVNRAISRFKRGPKQAMCAMQSASQKTLLRCNAFHCD